MGDYDVAMASDQERNQHLATYKRIGNDPPTIPKSTMHAGLEDALTSRRDYEAKKKNPGGMVDFGRGYGTAIRNYLPEEIPEGQELQDANELRRVQCPITLCNNLRFSTRLIVQTTLSLIPRKKIQSLKRASQ